MHLQFVCHSTQRDQGLASRHPLIHHRSFVLVPPADKRVTIDRDWVTISCNNDGAAVERALELGVSSEDAIFRLPLWSSDDELHVSALSSNAQYSNPTFWGIDHV